VFDRVIDNTGGRRGLALGEVDVFDIHALR
jgi:hypothetical protein